MSIVESLLLYNPIEALVLILFCDIFTKRKFKKTDIIHCYILGGINLLIQSIKYLFSDTTTVFIYDIVSVFVIGSMVLYFYYFIIIGCNIKFKYIIMSHVVNYVFTCFIIFFLNYMFNEVYKFGFKSYEYEFLANILLRICEITIFLIIKFGVKLYERHLKKGCSK